MNSYSNGLVEYRQPIRRSHSLSTVGSSVADDIDQYYANFNRELEQRSIFVANKSRNLEFVNSEGIHVGTVEYHIHHHSEDDDTKSTLSKRTSLFSSITDIIEFRKKQLNSQVKINKNKNSLPILLFVMTILISSLSSIYFTLKYKTPKEKFPEFLCNITVSSSETTTITDSVTTTPSPDSEIPEYLMARDKWGADKPKSNSTPELEMPIQRIIIGHTGGEFCETEDKCAEIVKSIQSQDPSLDDIPFNFLIGGDGKIYEGRGIKYQGQHTQNEDGTEYNSIGICIAFIGNYQSITASYDQINLFDKFRNFLVESNLLDYSHIIVSQDDLKYFEIKATILNNIVATLENFRPLYKIYRREEWEAQKAIGYSEEINAINDKIIIDHTATEFCTNFNSCSETVRSLQADSFSRSMTDIVYNIIFGGNGLVFEGKGWDTSESINIGVIGDFTTEAPNDEMINAMLQVFDDAKALGKLDENYKIYGRSDIDGNSRGPGEAFTKVIKEWCNYWIIEEPCFKIFAIF